MLCAVLCCAVQLVFAMAGKFGCSAAWAMGLTYTGELFPTTLRSAALGVASQVSPSVWHAAWGMGHARRMPDREACVWANTLLAVPQQPMMMMRGALWPRGSNGSMQAAGRMRSVRRLKAMQPVCAPPPCHAMPASLGQRLCLRHVVFLCMRACVRV